MVADAILPCGHGDPGEGCPTLPLLLVGPVGDGGRQVVGGVSGWRGSRPESENPGNGGNEACGYLGRGEAENVVAMAGNVNVTMDLVLENIESVLGSANVFAVAVDFDNQPIVEEEIHAFKRPPTNNGAVGDRDDGLWGDQCCGKLGDDGVAGPGFLHGFDAVAGKVENALEFDHVPLPTVGGEVVLKFLLGVAPVEGGFEVGQCFQFTMAGIDVGEGAGDGGDPVACDIGDVFRREVGVTVVEIGRPLAAGRRSMVVGQGEFDVGVVILVEDGNALDEGRRQAADDGGSAGNGCRLNVNNKLLFGGCIGVVEAGDTPLLGKEDQIGGRRRRGGCSGGGDGGGGAGDEREHRWGWCCCSWEGTWAQL